MSNKNDFTGLVFYSPAGHGFNTTPDYSITCANTTIDEGATATFAVRAFGIPTGGTIQWGIIDSNNIGPGRFSSTSGDITMLNNYMGAFEVTVSADNTTASGPQGYLVGLFWNEQLINSTIFEMSVNDSSQNPTSFAWTSDVNLWGYGVGSMGPGTISNPAPGYPSYTYPDGSTGKIDVFTGAESIVSPNLKIPTAFTTNGITIDFWFYPTSNDIQLLSEQGSNIANTTFHFSLLEIDSSGYIKAKFWQEGDPLTHSVITSSNTVNLNDWNHVYFTEDLAGSHSFELNGIGTGMSNPTYTRLAPWVFNSSLGQYFGMGVSDGTYMTTINPFVGQLGRLVVSDNVVPSTYSSLLPKFTLPLSGPQLFVGYQASGNDGSNAVHIDSNSTTDPWCSMVPVGATIVAAGYGTYTVTHTSTPTAPGNYSNNWWFSVTPTTSFFAVGTMMTVTWTA